VKDVEMSLKTIDRQDSESSNRVETFCVCLVYHKENVSLSTDNTCMYDGV